MTTVRLSVRGEMLEWALRRGGFTANSFIEAHPKFKLAEWLTADAKPTLRQLEEFARTVRVPFGALFLPHPPDETLPIEDFRIMGNAPPRPSADLLDTVYLCQQRQEWYRIYASLNRIDPVKFVGTARTQDDIEMTADRWRETLALSRQERREVRTWTEAFKRMVDKTENAGAMVMVSGVVGNNNTRKLDPKEFRGFVLCDPLAPLIFINSADSRAAQIFTLAHEIGHLLLSTSALTNITFRASRLHRVEQWCNAFAAELLVPRREFMKRGTEDLNALAREYKVSALVILLRLREIEAISDSEFWSRYEQEINRAMSQDRHSSGGGNYYATTLKRAGKRFTRAVIEAALEGRGSFTDAMRLIGFKRMEVFRELASMSGVTD